MKLLHGVTIYSFAGWVLESLYHKALCGSFRRPHFSWLPFKPMYGIAAMLLVKTKQKGKLRAVVAAGGIPTAVEFLSGYWLRQSYGLKYWDYSQEKGNIQGLVCPKFMAYWMALGSLLVYQVQPKMEKWLKGCQERGQKLLSAAAFLMVTDVQCNLWRREHNKRRTSLAHK